MTGTLGKFSAQKTSEVVYEGSCVLVYGPPGSGKTTLSGGVADDPDNLPAALLDLEGGAKSLRHRDDIDRYSSDSWQETDSLLTSLERETHGYKSLIFDNVSEAQRQDIDTITKGAIEWKEWNITTSHILRLIRRLRDLSKHKGMNVIICGWENTDNNDQTGVTKRIPGLNPALARNVPGVVDVVGYLTPETRLPDDWRHFILAESARTSAKMRRGLDDMAQSIPGEIYYHVRELPTSDLLAAIKGVRAFPARKYVAPVRATVGAGTRAGATSNNKE